MEWETTPSVAENGIVGQQGKDGLAREGTRTFLITTQLSKPNLNKPDLNMNIVPANQGVYGALSNTSIAGPDTVNVLESLSKLQDPCTELREYKRPSPGPTCSLDILQHWEKLVEPGVACSSPNPASMPASGSQGSQTSNDSPLSSPLPQDSNSGTESMQTALHQISTSGTVIAFNPVDGSIILRHGEKLIKVTNFTCFDKNFNLALVSDLAKNAPSTDKNSCENVNYRGCSDLKGHLWSNDSKPNLAKAGVEVAGLKPAQGYLAGGSHINNSVLNTNGEQQVILIDAGQGVSLLPGGPQTSVPCASAGCSSVGTVKSGRDLRTVESVRDLRSVESVRDLRTVESVKGSRTVESVRDSRTVESVKGSRTVGSVTDLRRLEPMRDSRPEQSVRDSRPEQSVRDSRPEQSVRDSRPEQSVRDSRPEQSVRDSRPEQSVRDWRPEQSVRDSRPEQSVRDSKVPLYPPASQMIKLACVSPTDQNITSISVTDPPTKSMNVETDIEFSKTTYGSKTSILDSTQQITYTDGNTNTCSNVLTDMADDGTIHPHLTTKTVSLPRSTSLQICHTQSNLLDAKTNIINKSFSDSTQNEADIKTSILTQYSSYKHASDNGVISACNVTKTLPNNHQTSSTDRNVGVKTDTTSQQTVTFCVPSIRNFPEKSLLPSSKASILKLSRLDRNPQQTASFHTTSNILPLKSHVGQEIKHTHKRGTLNIQPKRDRTTVPSFSDRNLKLHSSGHKAATDRTPYPGEDSCDGNSAKAGNSSQLTSSSNVLRSLALETQQSLNRFRKRQHHVSETNSQTGMCTSTDRSPQTHSSTVRSKGQPVSRSLNLNNSPPASSTLTSLNSAHPLSQQGIFYSDSSSTSMDTYDVAMSPASVDTSVVSPDTGISSSTSLPSSSSFSLDDSSGPTSESPPAASSLSTPTISSSNTEPLTATAHSGRSLRIRHQRRFLPEKPRHKRQTLQDMTRPLKQWLYKHRENPYPTKVEKVELVKHSHMSLTQVSNWFANARRRLKNTVQGEDLSWAKRIQDYNQYAEGNAELFSLPSSDDDDQWDSTDELNDNIDQDSYSHSATRASITPSPVPILTSPVSDPALISTPTTQPCVGSPSTSLRCSPNLEEQQGAYHKYKHSILQRYLHDASQQIPIPDDEVVTSRARHRNLSSSTGSHDFEYLSTSSVSSPSHEMPHDSFDEFSEEFETIAIRRRAPDNSTNQGTDDLYWKEIGAALALASLARAHTSK